MKGVPTRPLAITAVLTLAFLFALAGAESRAEAAFLEAGVARPIDPEVDAGIAAGDVLTDIAPLTSSGDALVNIAPVANSNDVADDVDAPAAAGDPFPELDPIPIADDIPHEVEPIGPKNAALPDLAPEAALPRIEIGGQEIEPGTKQRIVLHASESFVGASVETPVVIIRGHAAGPTLCLTAGIHGDELNGTETVRRVLARIGPEDLDGTLIGLPIVNVHGFRSRSRYLPDRRDLNRHFPGSPHGSSASRIANVIFEGVIRHCDALIDFHSGSFHRSNLPQVRGDFTSTDILELARGLGVAVAVHHPGIVGTLRREATVQEIPTVLYEGGESLRLQGPEIQRGENGVLRLLRYIGMLNVPYEVEEREQEFFFDSNWVRVNHGGIFVPSVELGDRVEVDAALATVFDPLGGERAVVRAPIAGRVIGMAMAQVVIPGFAAFHIGDERAPQPEPAGPGDPRPEVADLEHTE
ncbi:MAG: succinylglutamate desuccinylase/aspartoacylase family protein [Candidatus Binatia bacterium]|nr:succinylglutamate desuccinylase/aspartoacylase family protein [Candidatus Binatia bacterium]